MTKKSSKLIAQIFFLARNQLIQHNPAKLRIIRKPHTLEQVGSMFCASVYLLVAKTGR
jgi:hypothetical protein